MLCNPSRAAQHDVLTVVPVIREVIGFCNVYPVVWLMAMPLQIRLRVMSKCNNEISLEGLKELDCVQSSSNIERLRCITSEKKNFLFIYINVNVNGYI